MDALRDTGNPDSATDDSRGDIAIIGMSCLYPGAPDLASYWRNIVAKFDAITDPPPGDWDPQQYYDPGSNANDKTYCIRGGYLGDLALFRPFEFGVMPVTVNGGEPDQWLALQVAHEALADAGYADPTLANLKTEIVLGKGTYINRGNMTAGYHGVVVGEILRILKNLHPEYEDADLAQIRAELKAELPPFSADTAPALIGNIIAGRIANRFDFMGPSFTVDGACASAMLAVDIAVSDLKSAKCDLVLAGGVNVNVPVVTNVLFCQLGALSRKQEIRPFDKSADGTLLSEGLGVLVLKRLGDAERDGDRIYAVIKGVGTASDGRAQHVMAPRLEGEVLALRRAYAMAGVAPDTVGLLEAHGTATPVGDAVEVQALKQVFGARSGPYSSCALGSVKSMIGHTMPAAGAAGIIKAALALYYRILPPSLHCEEPDPALELEHSPFYVNTEARPWIHGRKSPRRAGVNAFGFGGINGHVVLEEYPGNAANFINALPWDSEVCILAAATRDELTEQATQVRQYLAGNEAVPLANIAYSANSRLADGPLRLGVVAATTADLNSKLEHALQRLQDPNCRQIKDSRGIYFFAERLAATGKLAFLFPGEGSQYPNMLLDLCMHFPEVRQCFDSADRAFADHPEWPFPSEFVFPRKTVGGTERRQVEETLWTIDGAVRAVLNSNWAIWTLLRKLRIQADAIVGHSTGDYAAMFAANVIQTPANTNYGDFILAMTEAHERLSQEVQIQETVLLAVAAEAAELADLLPAGSTEIQVAMDNCPHQTVLAGPGHAVTPFIEKLQAAGLIYEVLRFDRPYHTRGFREYAERLCAEFFARLPLARPGTVLYSCTTAAPYPDKLDDIKRLFIDHLIRPVRFRETVERMYADGVRIFVESGPRGNLSAFVSDTLRGVPHLAIPANVNTRSGLTQLNHLVAILAAQGVALDPSYLYAHRQVQALDWQQPRTATAKTAAPPTMKIATGIPPLRVKPRAQGTGSSRPAPEPSVPGMQPVAREVPSRSAPDLAYAAAPQTQQVPATTRIMGEYLKGMQDFLDLQKQTMQAFLRDSAAEPMADPRLDAGSDSARYPLLGRIVALQPGTALIAERILDVQDDLFLQDHALGGSVSVTDPALRAVTVLPLTMSMEILAEAAAILLPGQRLVGMRNISATQWIRCDDEPLSLRIVAQLTQAGEVEVEIQTPQALPAGGLSDYRSVCRGTMLFAAQYPLPVERSIQALQARDVSRLAARKLYDGSLMFHGPCFQGVKSIDYSGKNGLDASLQVLPRTGLFRGDPDPALLTDPVLLDAAGQLVGFWTAEKLREGFVVFPFALEQLTLYADPEPVGAMVHCQLRLELAGDDRVYSDLRLSTSQGMPLLELRGWADRRFYVAKAFYRFWLEPGRHALSEPWPELLQSLPAAASYRACRLPIPFPAGAGLWQDLWASLILSRKERAAVKRKSSTALGKYLPELAAAKDAVRQYLQDQHELQLLPADIDIVSDHNGRRLATGAWAKQVPALPWVVSAADDGLAVALAGAERNNRYPGLALRAIRGSATELLSAQELRLVSAFPEQDRPRVSTAMCCAKEAVANACNSACTPESSTVLHITPAIDRIVIRPGAGQAASLAAGLHGECTVQLRQQQRHLLAIFLQDPSAYD